MNQPTDNLALWNSVRTPDPNRTRQFTRGGGFKGTAINAVYLIQLATEKWGPLGGQWGIDIVDEKLLTGAPILGPDKCTVIGHESVHVLRINLRHPNGVVPAFGQTTFVGTNKYGPVTDEEAPKKSLTDAVTKALSWLGFAADIHMGMWDDHKYLNDVRQRFSDAPPPEPGNAPPEQRLSNAKEDAHLAAIRACTDQKQLTAARDAAKAECEAIGDRDAYTRIAAAVRVRAEELISTQTPKTTKAAKPK